MRKKRVVNEQEKFRFELKQRLHGILDRALSEKDYIIRAGTLRGGIKAIISSLENRIDH